MRSWDDDRCSKPRGVERCPRLRSTQVSASRPAPELSSLGARLGLTLVLAVGLPLLSACGPSPTPVSESFSVEIWTDSLPGNPVESQAVLLASGVMEPHHEHRGLYFLKAPVRATLASGLAVEVSCERVATGHFHCSMSHAGELVSSGKYTGPFTVRVFPKRHQSYVLDVNSRLNPASG